MSQKIRMMAAFVAMIGFVAFAEAQPRPGEGRPGGGRGPGGGFDGGVVNLITNAEVQSDIKLSDEQKDKLAAWYEKHQDKVEEKTKDVGRDFRKRFEIMAELNKEAEKEIEGVLKPEQLKRVKQIGLQKQGTRALTSEEIQKDLGITEEQKEKFQKIGEESREAFRDAFQPGMRPDFEKMQAMRKEISEKYQAVLTSDQKAKWKVMIGEPFDTSKLRPQFGGGGNGGQPRRRNNDNNNN